MKLTSGKTMPILDMNGKTTGWSFTVMLNDTEMSVVGDKSASKEAAISKMNKFLDKVKKPMKD